MNKEYNGYNLQYMYEDLYDMIKNGFPLIQEFLSSEDLRVMELNQFTDYINSMPSIDAFLHCQEIDTDFNLDYIIELNDFR